MKFKSEIKSIIVWIAVGIFSSLLSHFIIELVYFDYEFQFVIEQITDIRPELFILGSGILFVIYILISSLFGSSLMGSLLLMLLSWVVGTATSLKILHRGEPIYPNELYWLKELPFLLDMIGWQVALFITIVIIIAIVLLVICYRRYIKPRKKNHSTITNILLRVTGVLISIGLLFYFSRFNYTGNKIKDTYDEYASWVGWSQMTNYNTNGFVAGFLYNLNAQPMNPPSNYSRDSIEQLLNKYKSKSIELNRDSNPETDTNIIYVMNESFSDPSNLEGVESNKDPLPNYRDIIEETLSGSLLVPGIGGGTATTEFQVLTGISMEPLSHLITSPFVQLTGRMEGFPSVTNKMNKHGYNTTAIHAFSPTFYRRRDVYDYLNFDAFIHEDTMQYTETPTESHPYISDESIYKELFDVMNSTEGPDFFHLVTMQNHGGYINKYEELDYDVTGTGNYGSANGYFQDLEVSDIALRRLIDEIDEYPEPVLLLFWGDHLPGFYEGEVTQNNSSIKIRETPFFIYSNEKELDEEIGLRSLIYLNNYVFDILNFDVTPFEALLIDLEKVLPVLDKRMYYESNDDQVYRSREELNEQSLNVLNDYTLLMYDITTGNNYARTLGFFEYYD